MKPIKFRIKDEVGQDNYIELKVENGEVVLENRTKFRMSAKFVAENIAQFVCYDADGNEVYEGDALIDEEGMPINSLYVGIIDSDSNAIDGKIGDQFGDVWLEKE